MRKFLLLFTIVILSYALLGAEGNAPAVGFLKLGIGARPAGMGGAFCAIVDDATSLYWNPAGLTGIENQSVTFMHALYIDSSFFDYVAYAGDFGSYGSLGVGIQYISAGEITETDETGTEIGSYTPNDTVISLGYALRYSFSVGITVKSIKSTIINSAQTQAIDLGILSPGYLDDRLRLALTVANIGGNIKFEQEQERLPLINKIGSAYKIKEQWIVGLDIALSGEEASYVSLGTEYILQVGSISELAGRIGFTSRNSGDNDGPSGISMGFGFSSQKFSIDYGYVPFGSMGLTHRLSLTYKM
jgi:hypothetical protein